MALPVVIQEFIRLIGHGKTMALVREFGGQEVRFPKAEGSDTWAALVEVVGESATKHLGEAFSGSDPIYIALCTRALLADRNRRMIACYEALIKDGHSGRGAVSVIVREFRPISNRQVENIVNAPLPEPAGLSFQAQLF